MQLKRYVITESTLLIVKVLQGFHKTLIPGKTLKLKIIKKKTGEPGIKTFYKKLKSQEYWTYISKTPGNPWTLKSFTCKK